jgi:hypothetical protein
VRGQAENLIKLVINLKTAKALGSQPLMARTCRSGMSTARPLSGAIRTLRRHRRMTGSDPNRSLGSIAYQPLVADRAMEAWYYPSIA